MKPRIKKLRRWVIKAGSKMVCEGGLPLMDSWMSQVRQLRKLHNIEVIWVTSGAIAWAADHTHFTATKKTLPEKQALSAIGQPLVMAAYQTAFLKHKILGSQVLLTANDMLDPERRRNLKNTLKELLLWKALPVLNENDAVATDEIKFGDNDSLACKVAVMMKAERLILMTDVAGLFDSDPNMAKKASLVTYRKKVSPAEFALVDKTSVSKQGTGGMQSKLMAADLAVRSGIVTHLIQGDHANNLLLIAQEQPLGTQFGGVDVSAI